MEGWFRRTLAIGEPVSRHVGGLSRCVMSVFEKSACCIPHVCSVVDRKKSKRHARGTAPFSWLPILIEDVSF